MEPSERMRVSEPSDEGMTGEEPGRIRESEPSREGMTSEELAAANNATGGRKTINSAALDATLSGPDETARLVREELGTEADRSGQDNQIYKD
jgi:hypothetical protein